MSFSWVRCTTRMISSPHVCSESLENWSWLKGMRISAVHPPESTLVASCHTGSQESSPSFQSPRQPAGSTAKVTWWSRSW